MPPTPHEGLEFHFDFVVALAQKLRAHEIGLYEHIFHGVPFGSWSVTFGRHRTRVRFSYDASCSTLRVQQADAPAADSYPDWSQVRVEDVDFDERQTGYHAEMERIVYERFAV